MTVVPAGSSTSPTVTGTLVSRKSPRTGLSNRSVSSMNRGSRSRLARSRACSSAILGEHHHRGAEQSNGGLLARGEQVGRHPHRVDDLGGAAVRERRRRNAGEHVVARVLPSIADVFGELAVQVLQRRVLQRVALAAADGARCAPLSSARSKSAWSDSGTPSRSAITSIAKGLANSSLNSHRAVGQHLRRTAGRRASR